MIRRSGWFIGGLIFLWGAALAMASIAWPQQYQTQWMLASVASVLCALPALATILWLSWSAHQSPLHLFQAVFGGVAVRMFVVLGVAISLVFLHPYFKLHLRPFLLWVSFFYLTTLFLEVCILVGTGLIPLTVATSRNTPPQDKANMTNFPQSEDSAGNGVAQPIDQGGTS